MTARPRTVAILQARMGSTRLPGKVLEDLAGLPVLAHCIARAAAVPGVDAVCVATGEGAEDDPVADLVARDGRATPFRGSTLDVLDRYLGAARATRADIVLRITCDCPLLDPAVAGRVLAARAAADADYACNNMPPSFPHGLDCEAFPAAVLERAAAEATEPGDREHVTPWIRRHRDLRRTSVIHEGPSLADERWTLDWPEDLAFLRAVFERLPADFRGDMETVLALLDAEPALRRLNAGRRVAHTA